MDWKKYSRLIPRRAAKFAALLVLASPCVAADWSSCPENSRGWDRFCYYHCHWFWECCHGPYGNPRTHQVPHGTPGSCPPHGPTFGYYAPMWQPWPECYSEVEVVEPAEAVPSEPAMPAPPSKAPEQSQRMNQRPQSAVRSTKKLADAESASKVERLPASTPVAQPPVVASQSPQAVPAPETSLTQTPRPRVLLAQPQTAKSQPQPAKPPTAKPQLSEQQVADQRVEQGPVQTSYISLAPAPPAVPAPKPVATAPQVAQPGPATLRPAPPAFSTSKTTVVVKPDQGSSQSNGAPVGRMILK